MVRFRWGNRDGERANVRQHELKEHARDWAAAAEQKPAAIKAKEDAALIAKLREFYSQLSSPFVGKEEDARLITLALIAKEHVIFISEPGTAKSALTVRAGDLTKARVFKKQLSKFTDPAELFGPPDAKAIMDRGIYRTVTKGMLPEADIAFIDEIFRGGSAIRDTLLSIMNERVMFNGEETIKVPVRTIISATNFVSYDDEDQALYDRFLLRHFISPLGKENWGALVKAAWDVEFKGTANVTDPVLSLSDLDSIYGKLQGVNTSKVNDLLIDIYVKVEERHQIHITDRRKGRALKLIAANALLEGRSYATVEDLAVLKYILPRDEEESVKINAMLNDVISPINHINRLAKINENMKIAIEQLQQNAQIASDFDHDLATTQKAAAEARKLMTIHSDKELRKNARALLRSANELTAILTTLKEERDAHMADLTVVARNEVPS